MNLRAHDSLLRAVRRTTAVCGLLGLAGLGAPARAESVRVLASVGEIPGAHRAGDRLEAGSALVVPAGTTLQLGLGPGAVLALLGPARGRVAKRGGAVELREVEAARLAGAAALVLPGGFRVEPGRTGSVVFARGELHVRAGEVRVTAPRGRALAPVGHAELPPTTRLQAPRSVRLGLGDELLPALASLPEETEARLGRFEAPPAWRHGLGPVSAAEVSRAMEALRAERQREKQLAACGCTESKSGSAGQLPGSGSGLSPIERSAATLKVRITGIPRSAP